jgi:hypothetical protein
VRLPGYSLCEIFGHQRSLNSIESAILNLEGNQQDIRRVSS